MDRIHDWIGHGQNITAWQMALRAVIMFIVVLILIRIGGVRIFGKRSGFDTIIVIVMGSVVARGIVGSSPFLATILAAAAMIAVHRLFAALCANRTLEIIIKGKPLPLYKEGKVITKNLRRGSLTEEDLRESLHLEIKSTSLEKVDSACLETNGRISFVLKEEPATP